MPIDRTKDKDHFAQMIRSWIDQFAHTLSSTDTKKYIEMLVIEPFMNFMMERMFPYFIIAICIFTVIFIGVILCCVILIMNNKRISLCPFCEKSF